MIFCQPINFKNGFTTEEHWEHFWEVFRWLNTLWRCGKRFDPLDMAKSLAYERSVISDLNRELIEKQRKWSEERKRLNEEISQQNIEIKRLRKGLDREKGIRMEVEKLKDDAINRIKHLVNK